MSYFRSFLCPLIIILLLCTILPNTSLAANQKIYDFAEVLTKDERQELEGIAQHYSKLSEIDIIILTTANTEGRDVVQYTDDFYDDMGLGYNQPFGDTVILTIDMENREVNVAGFYKGEEHIDNFRADLIRRKITSDLSASEFYNAFNTYIELTNEYMNMKPGVNPNNIFYNTWFQILISIVVASISLGVMAYQSGGRKTTNARTYLDQSNSKVTSRKDRYVRTSVTKVKKPSKKSGGGGGFTGGGHSRSGSRGGF